MDKTVVVKVERLVRHPLYKKVIRKASKFYAHDEFNECRIGDVVEIMETRPLSKLKRWRVVRILQRAKAPLLATRKEVTEGELLEEVLTKGVETVEEISEDGESREISQQQAVEQQSGEAQPSGEEISDVRNSDPNFKQ